MAVLGPCNLREQIGLHWLAISTQLPARGTVKFWMNSSIHREMIANIPICTRRQDDFWAWHYERSGLFSVRSAYRMLVNQREAERACLVGVAGRSDRRGEQKEWSMLWKTRIPSKIRTFLWRLAHRSVPFGDVLKRRNMAQHDACVLCGSPDSWRHSLLECNMARSVWALQPSLVVEYLHNVPEHNARLWLATIMVTLSQEEMTRVGVVLWAIWYARRKVIHENIFQSPLSTHCFVERFIEDLKATASKQKDDRKMISNSPCWRAPPVGYAKINVDAGLSKTSGTVAVAAVIRDAVGEFMGGIISSFGRHFRC